MGVSPNGVQWKKAMQLDAAALLPEFEAGAMDHLAGLRHLDHLHVASCGSQYSSVRALSRPNHVSGASRDIFWKEIRTEYD